MKVRYCVRAEAIEQDGRKYALVGVIDESECRNEWRINPAGKARLNGKAWGRDVHNLRGGIRQFC